MGFGGRSKVEHLIDVTFMLRPLHAVQTLVSAMAAKGAQPALDLEAGGEQCLEATNG